MEDNEDYAIAMGISQDMVNPRRNLLTDIEVHNPAPSPNENSVNTHEDLRRQANLHTEVEARLADISESIYDSFLYHDSSVFQAAVQYITALHDRLDSMHQASPAGTNLPA